MEISNLFGLPAHPLVVHAAVVLLPLAAIITLVVAAIPRSRRHYAPIALGLAVVATLAVATAQGSGEQLQERVTETELLKQHTGQGENVLPWAIGVTVAAAAATAWEPLSKRYPKARLAGPKPTAALIAFALITTVGATWVIIDVGHSGAKATWNQVSETGRVNGG